MNITNYTNVKALVSEDMLLIDGPNGTRTINAPALIAELMEFLPPETHRTIFRGKDLGTVFTDEQFANVQNSTFKDLWMGDFWTIGGKKYRIVDINYFYNTYYEKKPHLVIMPDHALYSAKMNTSNITTGGYHGSDMYKNGLTNAKTTINAAFNNHIWKHYEYLSNAVTNGIVTGCSDYAVDVAIPSETMMYGHTIYASPFNKDGVTDNLADMYPFDKSQFALFAAQPQLITDENNWCWLRDVVSSEYFAFVDNLGFASCNYASNSRGVRPYFCVG